MTFNWGEVKAEIERLYMKEGKSLDEVRVILKATHNFNPSIRAYKDKLEEWGYKKYNRRQKGAAAAALELNQDLDIVQTTEAASALLSGSNPEIIKSNLAQADHELERQASQVREQRVVLGKVSRKRRRQGLEPDAEEAKHSLERVAKLETSITQMRKTLEQIMTSVNVQTSGPTGFASCWKQEPMTLEDAHGKLLPLPLELVVSWEMLDSILLGHFRAVIGEKKVQKREFEIGDSMTRSTLTRKRPWSQICRPGRKIEMSMIFKDIDKTSVVCPKCDTISKEEKGVQVECPNPDCKMIFRTEDDDDSAKISSMELKPHLRKKRKTMERATLDDDSSCEEDPEDKPGMFKRVIIRLLKRSLETSSWTDYASPPKFTNPWAPGLILPTNIEPRSSYHFNPSRGLMASEILRGADPSAFVSHPVVEEIASNLSTFDPEPFSGYLSSLGLNSGFFSSSLESEQSVQSHINVQTNPETMTSRGGSITQRPHITKADRARMEQEKLDRQKMVTMTQTPGNHGGGMAQLASVPNMSNTKCPTCTWPNDRLQFSCVYCGESLDIRDLQGPNEPGLDPGHLEDANEQRFVSDPLDDLLDPFDYIFGTLGTTGSVPASPKLPDQQEHDYRDLEDPAEYLFRTMGTPALICRTLPTLTLPGGLFNTPMTPTSDSLSSATTLTSDMSRQNSAMGLNSVSLESIQMMRCSSDPAFYEEQQQQAMQ